MSEDHVGTPPRSARAGSRFDVVVADAGERQALVAVRSLGRSGVRVGAVECRSSGRPPAFSSRYCRAKARLADRRYSSGQLVEQLVDFADDGGATVVIPVNDGTIAAIRARRSLVERRVHVALASEPALGVAVDKAQTYARAMGLGIRIPRMVHVTTLSEVDAAARECGMPVVFKPTMSWVGGTTGPPRFGAGIASSLEDLRRGAGALIDAGAEVLIQEWLPGRREAVSFVYSSGSFFGEFAQFASRTSPPLGGCSVVRESIEPPSDVLESSRRLVAELGLEGYSEVEFRRDSEGVPVLMEINPRLSASVEVAVRSGIDFPVLIYQWATGERPDDSSGYRTGTRMRWLAGDVQWLRDTWQNQGEPDVVTRERAIYELVRDSVRPFGYDSIDRHDLRPLAGAAALAVRRRSAALGRWLQRTG